MASRAEGFGWLAMMAAVAVWVLGATPLSGWGTAREAAAGQTSEAVSSATSVPATANAVIEEMARAAEVIFAGQVVAVRRPIGFDGSGGSSGEGVVEVDLRVDRAVRGPETGAVYTLREWSGLWDASSGGARYRVGQRLLVFFYKPGPHGLSSPVGGLDGAIPLRGGGAAPGPDDSTDAPAQWMVDLRWVQARALVRNALVMLTVRKPVSPRPNHMFMPEEMTERGSVEVGVPLVRRFPLPQPTQTLSPPPVETEPLAQVLMLCQRSMRRADVAR